MIKPLLRFLTPGGYLIITLKFVGVGRERGEWLEKIPALLDCKVRQARLLWLFSNTVYERTYCCCVD